MFHAMMLSIASAAGGRIGLRITCEQRRDQWKGQQEEQQSCSDAPHSNHQLNWECST